MKKEETIIGYRPELAQRLKAAMDMAIKLYSANFQKIHYGMLASVYEDIDKNASEFFKAISDCFDKYYFSEEVFAEHYEYDLIHKYHMSPVSETAAARSVYQTFGKVFDTMEKNIFIKYSNLTRYEVFSIQSFFRKLTAPMRDPNLLLEEGQLVCHYEENHKPYSSTLKRSIEYIEKECPYLIELFDAPLEPKLESDDKGKEEDL